MTRQLTLTTDEQLALAIGREMTAAAEAGQNGDDRTARRHRRQGGLLAERLLSRLEPVVHRVCSALLRLTRRAGLELDDLKQEAYLALLKALPRYVPGRGRSLAAFVRAVLTFRFIGLSRRHQPEFKGDCSGFPQRGSREDAEHQALRTELRDVLEGVLPGVSNRTLKLRLFRDYYFEDRTLQEVATANGLSTTSVYRHVAEVLSAVREVCLGDEGNLATLAAAPGNTNMTRHRCGKVA
jgi:RNA polymerase sigma factor (sigma-70 family)